MLHLRNPIKSDGKLQALTFGVFIRFLLPVQGQKWNFDSRTNECPRVTCCKALWSLFASLSMVIGPFHILIIPEKFN